MSFCTTKVAGTSAPQNAAIELAATATSVACYHPLRTMGVCSMSNQALSYTPKFLYRGFGYGFLGAHQIFLMSYFYRTLSGWVDHEKTDLSKIMIAAVSGISSAPTTTYFEGKALQKQLKITPLQSSALPSGFFPQAGRQVGLSIGMFPMPEIVNNKMHELVPEFASNNSKIVKVASSLISGGVAAIGTHVFEMARMKMQSDPAGAMKSGAAFKEACRTVLSSKSMHYLAVRLSILPVATASMNISRDFYRNKFLSNGDSK